MTRLLVFLLRLTPTVMQQGRKLLTRKAKSCFFAGLYEDATAEVDAASPTSAEVETLSKGVQSYLSAAKHVRDPLKVRQEIVTNLPRYKPNL